MRGRVKKAKVPSEESLPLCGWVSVRVWEKEKERKGRESAFGVCMFVFVGVDHLIKRDLCPRRLQPQRQPCHSGAPSKANTPVPLFHFGFPLLGFFFFFLKAALCPVLTCIGLARHVGVHPHLYLTQEGCLAETDTATWIRTLMIRSNIGLHRSASKAFLCSPRLLLYLPSFKCSLETRGPKPWPEKWKLLLSLVPPNATMYFLWSYIFPSSSLHFEVNELNKTQKS